MKDGVEKLIRRNLRARCCGNLLPSFSEPGEISRDGCLVPGRFPATKAGAERPLCMRIPHLFFATLMGALLAYLLAEWISWRGVRENEGLFVRWLVVAGVHPIRMGLAAGLAFLAVRETFLLVRASPGLGKNGVFVTIRKAPPVHFAGTSSNEPAPTSFSRPTLAPPRGPSATATSEIHMSTSTRDSILSKPAQAEGLGLTIYIDPCQESFREGVFLSQAVVVTTIAKTLKALSKDGSKLKTIIVDGKYDPLEHPDFRAISENLKAIAKKWFPKAKLHLIGSPRFVNSPGRAVALLFYHEVTLRLEAGTQKTFAAMTGEKGSVLKDAVEILERLDLGNLVIRARFLRGEVDNSTPSEVRNWIKMLEGVKPSKVQIKSPKKGFLPKTKGVTSTRLAEILAELEEKLETPCEIIV
jgi:hypothetical protein